MSDNQRPGSRPALKGDTVTRIYKVLRFDPHLRRKALLIRGEVTVQVADSLCRQTIAEEVKEFRKLIRLDAVNELTDSSAVVDDIMEKCPFIEESRQIDLLSTIDTIKKRKYNENGFAIQPGRTSSEDSTTFTPTFPDYFEDESINGGIDSDVDLREITMESLEYYVELLYEQLPDKVKGARCIAKLATNVENLSEIYEHESAMNALFRTLREDYKKSMDLSTNILTLSLSFAIYQNFHPVFVTNKICSLLMDIVDYELDRFDKWIEELDSRKEIASNPQSSAKFKLEYERMKAKFSELTSRQDVLLCSGFNVIRLLTESQGYVKEIIRSGIVKLLMNCLDRKSTELLITVISFLKVLSTYRESNVQMTALDIIDRVHIMMDENSPKALLAPLLGLLFNLSFTTKLRQKMLKSDVLSKTFLLLDDEDLQPLCIPLLYNFSMDERIRPKFTEGLGSILQLITKPAGNALSLEVRALTLNLSSSKRCCQIICRNGGVPLILSLAFKYEDVLLMKIIRKLSQHEGATKRTFVDPICDIAGAILNATSQEFQVECLGTLGNLTIPDLDFKKLLEMCGLVPWLKSVLKITPTKRKKPGEERSLNETALLEAVIFVGTCAGDEDCTHYLIQEGVLEQLFLLSLNPNIDPDIIIQILFAFLKFCSHEKTRDHIVQSTDIPQVSIELLRHDLIGVREAAEAVLNTFMQLTGSMGETWKNRVIMEKFKAHNQAWINEVHLPTEESPASLLLPAYQKHHLDLFHPQPEFHDDDFMEHPDSGRSKVSSSSTSDTLTLSETETEDETEDDDEDGEQDLRGQLPSPPNPGLRGNPVHSTKSIFDQFKHQFMQERCVQDEYGMSEEDDEGGDDSSGLNKSFDDLKINGSPHSSRESLPRRNKSAKNLGADYQRTRENGQHNQVHSKTEDHIPRKNLSKPVMSVEIKRKS